MRYSDDMTQEFRTGYGRDWLDFAITRVGRYTDAPVDLVDTPRGLRAWLTEWHLAPTGGVSTDDVADAQTLREALHGLARAAAAGTEPAADDVRVVDRSLAHDVPVRLRRGEAGVALRRPRTTQEALARLARQAVDDLTGPNAARLRTCGDDECSGVYVDPTGRRRWCSDERCGVKARVRAHRARAKKGAAGTSRLSRT
jgi:predicted RNA-binding Zn ribbon-like protein